MLYGQGVLLLVHQLELERDIRRVQPILRPHTRDTSQRSLPLVRLPPNLQRVQRAQWNALHLHQREDRTAPWYRPQKITWLAQVEYPYKWSNVCWDGCEYWKRGGLEVFWEIGIDGIPLQLLEIFIISDWLHTSSIDIYPALVHRRVNPLDHLYNKWSWRLLSKLDRWIARD